MSDPLWLLLLTVALIALNGFFVAAEFAIVKVRATRIDELVTRGVRGARTAKTILSHLDSYLAACQVGITVASLALGAIGEPAIGRQLEPLVAAMGVESPAAVHTIAWAITLSIISFVHVVVGEQAPKAAAIAEAERTTLRVALILRVFHFLLYPGVWVTNAGSGLLLRMLGLKQASEADLAYSPDELGMIVETSAKAGLLNDQERRLLESAIRLSERKVREIMVPRPDIVWLDATRTLEQNIATIREQQHTRYPLATEDRDKVLGMIHAKDLMDALVRGEKDVALQKIARPVIFIPAVATLDRVLRTFQRSRTHMAILVDEYGGVAGLCTLEDVLEELVGDIRDEFDLEEREPKLEARPGEQVLDAAEPLGDVAARLQFEPAHANMETIGGYVLHLLGRLPKVGEGVTIGPFRVDVAEMAGLRITRLRVRRADARAKPGPDLARSDAGRPAGPGPGPEPPSGRSDLPAAKPDAPAKGEGAAKEAR